MVTILALISLAAWVSLVWYRGGYWRASERLEPAPAPSRWPEVVAVIPARNEAETIAETVSAHMSSDYPGRFSVILADDGSTDGTTNRAAEAADGEDRAFDVVSVPPLPEGWSGKLWAIQNGLERAAEVAPDAEYVLFTDADIVLTRDVLSRLVAKAEDEQLVLASMMAKLDARGRWGELLIPAFIYFFQKLYPFPLANDPTSNVAAAAGGCMLIRADALKAIGGVEAIRNELIDDCALARAMKDLTPSTKIWLGLAEDEAVSLRDNRALSSIWNMAARTAYAQLGYSPLMLAGTILSMAIIYLAPPLILLTFTWHHNLFATLYAAGAWALMAYSYWPTLKLYGREKWETALLPAAAALYTAMTLSSAQRHWRGEGGQWKGRTY